MIPPPLLSIGRRVRFRHVEGAVRHLDPSHVLDAGCGDGRFTAWLRDYFPAAQVTGLDSDGDLLARARVKHPNLDLRVGEVGSPVLAGRRFDLIVCTDVLEHIADDSGALRWFADRLEPGGRLVLHVPADDQWHFRSISDALRREVALGKGPHLREGYSTDVLQRLARDAGLLSVSVGATFVSLPVRLAVDIETWIATHGIRPLKLMVLPLLLAAVTTERRPRRGARGNGRLLVAEAGAR